MFHNNEGHLQSAKILIVEDDRRLLDALETRLAAMGCDCTCHDNASEAMVQFAAGNFDLVITDMTMPGIDGLSVIGMIRSQTKVPILVITGHSAEYARSIIAYPNVTLIPKPFKLPELTACVRSLLLKTPERETRLKCG
jgi:DNA-binding response OmpR family regulator